MSKLSDPQLFFTTALSAGHTEALKAANIGFHFTPFISFDFVDAAEWEPLLNNSTDAWVFTSKRAIKATQSVINQLEKPAHVFAVGPKTAQKLHKLGLSATVPHTYNIAALSDFISTCNIGHVTHFCGNLRSDVLKKNLTENNIEVQDVEVYRTFHSPQQIKLNDFDGFVFMSPSAVESFFKKNTLTNEHTIFCIGPSTGKAMENFHIHHYQQPEESTFDSLVQTIHNYYS
ncbi:MAG: uroporphyrinogen-III synthase [Balneolaceae bacterium]|nr:uroporphyrinogen-III synthase [Balneolaceae bacterium]